MTQTFHFVNGACADRKERKELRRHVMIGKNAGRTIHRPSRIKAFQQKSLELRDENVASICTKRDFERDSMNSGKVGKVPQWRLSEVKSVAFPVELTPQYAEIVATFLEFIADGMYPSHIGVSVEDAKRTWLQVMTADSSTFYCNIALMQACNALFKDEGHDSVISTTFLARSTAHVRRKIESQDALSCSTVAMVLSLVTQEQFRNEHKAARIHLDGLIRMIHLRGGLDTLAETVQVLLKVCKTDILFALEYGNTPVFYRDRMPQIRLMYTLDYTACDMNRNILNSRNHIDEAILYILVDIFDLCMLFNDPHGQHFRMDLYSYQEVIISISYRLLALDYIYQHPTVPTTEITYQLGSIVFMMILFLQYGRRRLHRFTRITQLLRGVIELHFTHYDKDQMLWLMITGGIWMMDGVWTLDKRSGDWLPPLILELAQDLGVQTWEEARSRIIKYPWIYKLQDEPGKKIWDRVHGGSVVSW
ncbi:hypothetical protein DM02DRAFT_668366 [Periconia macrospinosa]|uniref:Transcription factor domain-containing protein n=1 Tax=Periconia macrospinosa TaxID=97972 RepID=A0A2V1E5R2_9PLEO|nr:hypothetical protein DM02DRAFT_668366 [Periconia macrospinosa]